MSKLRNTAVVILVLLLLAGVAGTYFGTGDAPQRDKDWPGATPGGSYDHRL